MFTGIIETLGTVKDLNPELTNLHINIESDITHELKIDQSVSHNGICLTVVAINDKIYTVTAIQETWERTNILDWKIGDKVNLERCLKADGRFDGHIVQGHVDTVATCYHISDERGSWKYHFRYDSKEHITVEKGSITINGVSLTVVDSSDNTFSVAIIPYTHEHTNFHQFEIGTRVNLEFDIVGKYVAKLLNK